MATTDELAARAADLAGEVEVLARAIERLPSSAPLPSRVREAEHVLDDVAEGLRGWND